MSEPRELRGTPQVFVVGDSGLEGDLGVYHRRWACASWKADPDDVAAYVTVRRARHGRALRPCKKCAPDEFDDWRDEL